jgi:hypothetical protein
MRSGSGALGFVAVFLVSATEGRASPPVSPLPVTEPRAAPMPVRFVGTLDGLGESMKSDNLLHPRALSLAARRRAGTAVFAGGFLLGAVLSVGSMTFLAGQDCMDFAGQSTCHPSLNKTAVAGGMLALLGAVVGGYAIVPRPGEVIDLVNDWNVRHPEQPYALPPGFGREHHHHHH